VKFWCWLACSRWASGPHSLRPLGLSSARLIHQGWFKNSCRFHSSDCYPLYTWFKFTALPWSCSPECNVINNSAFCIHQSSYWS